MSQTVSQVDQVRGRAVVMQPEDGPSYWQPVPANGHADPKLYPARTGFAGHSMGFQTIAPSSRVREHSHGDQVDGQSHPLVPGTACFLGYDVRHELINESAQDDLVMLWVITPPGLETFFEAIGRPREAGAPAPAPFERPTDVIAIERRLGMNDTK